MGLYLADGTRVTKATVATTADTDPLVKITTDLYKTAPASEGDGHRGGSIRTLFCREGLELRQSEVDSLFVSPSVTGVNPATGPAAGDTVVTITGANLDGVTAVKFGANAGTALDVVSNFELNVTSPAGTAGPVDLVLTGDDGDVTETGAYTYE